MYVIINDSPTVYITFSEKAKQWFSENAHKYGLEFMNYGFVKDNRPVILKRHHPLYYDCFKDIGYEAMRGRYSHFHFEEIPDDDYYFCDESGQEEVYSISQLKIIKKEQMFEYADEKIYLSPTRCY